MSGVWGRGVCVLGGLFVVQLLQWLMYFLRSRIAFYYDICNPNFILCYTELGNFY